VCYLRAAQETGEVRGDLELGAGDSMPLPGCCWPGMLRRTGFANLLDYSEEDFFEVVTDLFYRGIMAPAGIKEERPA